MADATRLIAGGPRLAWVTFFAIASTTLQILMKYTRYVAVLKWLALALFAYVATMFMAHVSWVDALHGLLVPTLKFDRDYITTIVAVFGTTISPYLFFWQASHEAEDVKTIPERRILKRAPEQGADALARIELDTLVGMGLSNFIALSIMLTTAATLHAKNIRIETSAQAAEALRPSVGRLAEYVFAMGIIGTGLLAIPVLAGSAAYAIGEARKWPTGLDRRPLEAKAFYAAIVFATAIGMLLTFTPMNAIAALYWSAVVNGVVAVPVMAVMMVLASSSKVMGDFAIGATLKILGWAATGAMTIAAAAMIASVPG